MPGIANPNRSVPPFLAIHFGGLLHVPEEKEKAAVEPTQGDRLGSACGSLHGLAKICLLWLIEDCTRSQSE